jgi:hypothetical protein
VRRRGANSRPDRAKDGRDEPCDGWEEPSGTARARRHRASVIETVAIEYDARVGIKARHDKGRAASGREEASRTTPVPREL